MLNAAIRDIPASCACGWDWHWRSGRYIRRIYIDRACPWHTKPPASRKSEGVAT